jgi:cobalt-zinc-cadmium efflux system outer membrane protein
MTTNYRTGIMLACLIAVVARTSNCRGEDPPGLRFPAQPAENVLPQALSLADLEQMALAQNPTLVQASAQVSISRGQALQAGLRPNPTIGYVADQIGIAGTAGELQGMFIEQEIVTGHKLQLSRAKFMQETREAELQIMAQRYRVLHGVRIAYYNVLAQQRRQQIRKELERNSADVAKTLGELINVGQANRSDLLQAQIEFQRAKANFQRIESQLRGSWEELAAVVGNPDLQQASLAGELDFGDATPLNRKDALANLLACSPELRVAEAEVARDRIAVQRECIEPIPNVNVRAETGYNFENRDTVAGVEIGVRLPVFDKNQGTIIQARAELMRAQAEVTRVELMLRRRFAQSFAEYESAMSLAKSYHDEILPNAKKAYQLYSESFQQRRAAWPQVLDAQRQYYQLSDDYLDNLLIARQTEAKFATFFLEDGLSQPPTPSPEGHRDSTPKPR